MKNNVASLLPPRSFLTIGELSVGNHLPFVLIAGPCLMESRGHALEMAEALTNITKELGMGLIFKTSFDKANRTSHNSSRGLGIKASLPVFEEIKQTYCCPVLTDVHESAQCEILGPVVDVLQIPAFLCRQTDLILAAAKTGCALNIKKGQFLAPEDMAHVAAKAHQAGNTKTLLCDRGVSFGYHTLVSDFRAIPIMAQTGCPVVFDATHSVQQPGGQQGSSGGQRYFVETLARAAVAIGVAAVFIETHENPDAAPSDGPNMVPLNHLKDLLETLQRFDQVAKSQPYCPFSLSPAGAFLN